jgi:acyl-CoA thioesterase FadM
MAAHLHTARYPVAMSEVDVAQIHFTAVHRWMDRGLSEWLSEVGHPFTRLLREGPGIPIVETRCIFLGRIMLDDVIDQVTAIGGIGRTSFRSRHTFSRGGEVMARGELVHVCVDRETRATVPVPLWLRERASPEPGVSELDTS